jgi:hypothetical protein
LPLLLETILYSLLLEMQFYMVAVALEVGLKDRLLSPEQQARQAL